MDLTKIVINKLAIFTFHDCKSRSSFCWKYFGNLVLCEGNKKKILNSDQVYCSACLDAVKSQSEDVTFGSVKIKYYNKTVSTGNLTRHLRDDHQIRDKRVSGNKIDNILSVARPATAGSSETTSKYDKWVLAQDLALWFCKSLLPFDSLSDEGMTDFFKKYNIAVEDQLPTCYDVSDPALSDIYESILHNVKEKICADDAQHFAMAFDIWTNQYRRLNYITFTLHYLTCDFELKALTLSTQIITDKITGEDIEGMINDVKKQFGLESKKIHAVTAANENVRRAVLLAYMDHHLCLGHGLHNLVTVDGINSVPETESLVKKCKNIVKTIRNRLPELEADAKKVQKELLCSLESVAEMLECDESDPITQSELTVSENLEEVKEKNITASTSKEINFTSSTKTSTPTRWHIILEMLESLNKFCNQEPINKILKKIGQSELMFTQSEWALLVDLVIFLKRFREIVEILRSQSNCTMNVALVFRSEIIDILNSVLDHESSIILCLKRNMLANTDTRFPVTKMMVATALLDNRFMGLTEVDSYLEAHGMTRASFLASYVKEVVKTDEVTTAQPKYVAPSFLQKLSMKHSAGACPGIQDNPLEQECWRYLASFDPTEPKDGDLLSFWNDKKMTFPRLTALARSLLCVPATSTPSELMFFTNGLELSAKRSRLNPTKVNKIIFIHDNYKTCEASYKKEQVISGKW